MKRLNSFCEQLTGPALIACALLPGSAPAKGPIRMDAAGHAVPATVASFDCRKAASQAEHIICTQEAPAWMDQEIEDLYRHLSRHSAVAARPPAVLAQRAWLKRRDACTDQACVETTLAAREADLRRQSEALDLQLRHKVARVGGCDLTRIDEITTRLTRIEGEPPDGTSLGYADGVWQVSYDRDPAVLASRIGDPVRVCLASIPRHCPPGDGRGRVYAVENLRTHRRWAMSDSEHSCGGA
jgi:uncharacterized protein YecT (DUF1311 family)